MFALLPNLHRKWSLLLFVSACLLAFSIQSCRKNNGDIDPPSVYILNPTSEGVYVTTDGHVSLSGVAQDNDVLRSVSFVSNSGESGSADGLEEWSVPDLALMEGDNIIEIKATDANGNTSSASITITKNQSIVFLGVPFVDKDVVYANVPSEIWITASIAPNSDLIESSVKLIEVDADDQYVKDVCSMVDNGDLSSGDEIRGDNVFSAKHSFLFKNEETKRFRVSAKTQEDGEEIEGFSSVFTITSFLSNTVEDVVKEYVDIQHQIEQKFEELSDLPNDQKKDEMKKWLESLEGIDKVIEEDGGLTIEFVSGLTSYIVFSESGFRGGVQDERRRNTQSIPLHRQTRGEYVDMFSDGSNLATRSSGDTENSVIQNKNVLVWAPFSNAGVPAMDSDPFENSPIGLHVDYLINDGCSVDSFAIFKQYGVIIMDTHGVSGSSAFFTRQRVPSFAKLSLNAKLFLMTGLLKSSVLNGISYYCITPKYIKTRVGMRFPNSIVFNASCHSLATDLMADAFISKGAKTYLGFTNSVSNEVCYNKEQEFFSNLMGSELKTTGQSYVSDLNFQETDGSRTWQNSYLMRGNKEMHFYLGLINGDFEFGNLNGWDVEGDGRIITRLGPQSPTQPYYMGIVSTGLGYTTNYGSISQVFKVESENTLEIKWNFLSEEFLEYVGSRYQDYLSISIIDADGKTENILYLAVDDFAAKYELSYVSPKIVFDQGGVYMTGWMTSTFDISKYQGKTITLVIESGDVGDSIYDSATLLDEIRVY